MRNAEGGAVHRVHAVVCCLLAGGAPLATGGRRPDQDNDELQVYPFRVKLVCIVVVLLLMAALFQAQAPLRDRRPFRTGIELTSLTATVTDRQGGLITGLSRDAFEVFEDGERQQVTQFTNERVPVGVGVLLDTSDSMFGSRIRDAHAAVDRFLFELLDREDQFFLLVFNHAPHVVTGWSHDPETFRKALQALHPSGGTAVYDAILRALPMIGARERARAALVIISDGADTASDASLREVRAALARSDAFVYAIAIDSTDTRPINARVDVNTLRNITGESGGRTEVVHTTADIAAATARIAEELNSQYVLGYTSSHALDNQYHSIRVRVVGSDYRVRARRGYVRTP